MWEVINFITDNLGWLLERAYLIRLEKIQEINIKSVDLTKKGLSLTAWLSISNQIIDVLTFLKPEVL